MKNIKHLFFSSILCSLVLFTNCSEEDAAAIETASKATLTVTASPSEGGSVSPQGGTYDVGTSVEVTATANTNYAFAGWTGDFEGSSNPVTLTMLKDQTVTANFEFQDADGDGIADPDDTCADTPSDNSVNSNGCSDSQKDTDGDGITDDIDTCSDTPEGEIVNENGCTIVPNSIIYLGENGVTIIASDSAIVGQTYELDSVSYFVIGQNMLREMIINGEDVTKVVTTNVTNMDAMFAGTSFNQDISSWDVSKVTNMQDMFNGNSSFNQDISFWDVSKVTNMAYMFSLSGFNQDISSWDVSNVTDMAGTFYNTNSFNQDISSWDVSKVTNMAYMFWNAESFNQDIGSWDVSNVTDMKYMFEGPIFNQDIGSWDVSKVINMTGMLSYSKVNGDISNWDVSNVTSMNSMFFDAESFNQDISNWDVGNVTDMSYMFGKAISFNQDLSSWDVSNVTKCEEFSKEATAWLLPKPNFTNCDGGFVIGNFIYLDDNDITIKASEDAVIGESYELNGISYLVVSAAILNQMVDDGKDVTKVVTSNVTDMSSLF
ncbi:MAG: BspA family leucine-rich repeat surface protein, partial [Methylophagaceae bacterium]